MFFTVSSHTLTRLQVDTNDRILSIILVFFLSLSKLSVAYCLEFSCMSILCQGEVYNFEISHNALPSNIARRNVFVMYLVKEE